VLADRVAQRMLDVLVRHSMSARWLTNPRLDKLACLPLFVNISCLRGAGASDHRFRHCEVRPRRHRSSATSGSRGAWAARGAADDRFQRRCTTAARVG
jgi:hypothetical protein